MDRSVEEKAYANRFFAETNIADEFFVKASKLLK